MKRKVVIALMACIMCVTSVSGTIYGAGTTVNQAVSSRSGYISMGDGESSIVIRGNSGQSLLGKKFRIYKIFHAENSVGGESINYSFNDVYKTAVQNVVGKKLAKTPADVTEYEAIDYIQSLNNNRVEGAQTQQTLEGRYSQMRTFVEELRTEIVTLACKADEVTIDSTSGDGAVYIGGLQYGYYIVDEVSENAGTHSASSLCMVGTANPRADIRIKSDYPIVEKKLLEDDKKEAVGMDGWNDVGDYEIGQFIPFKFTSYVPNMNGYDTYYWAWHDVMAPELSMMDKTIKIEISKGIKKYQLQPSEYNLITNDPTVTFKVEIPDLKKIVDREFNSKDNLNHNSYGQTIVLSYDGYLNKKAAENTGRPGFENDVRLEFSNDPDVAGKGKTGFTPWDTVVCFTYQMNIKKTNNHNLPLENAEFTLYYDPECTQEVYVKKVDNSYNVIGKDLCEGRVPVDKSIITSDLNGDIIIKGLDQGTYYLKEIKAPAGYRKIEDPIVININPSFTDRRHYYKKGDGATDQTLTALEVNAHIKHFLDGKYTEATHNLTTNLEEGSGNLIVINHVGSKLPTTGSNMTLVILAVGAGMILLSRMIPDKKKDTWNEK